MIHWNTELHATVSLTYSFAIFLLTNCGRDLQPCDYIAYKSYFSIVKTAERNILLSIQVLKFNLTESGLFCVLPWLTMAFSANLGGWIADTLVSKGLFETTVRKVSLREMLNSPATFSLSLSLVISALFAPSTIYFMLILCSLMLFVLPDRSCNQLAFLALPSS